MKRIEEYQTYTLPIVAKQIQENRVISIDADQDIDTIHHGIVHTL